MSPDSTISPTTLAAPSAASHPDGVGTGRSNDAVIAAIRAHHTELAAQLQARTDAVVTAARNGEYVRELKVLHEWYRTELMPHAVAEEQALYSPGAELESTGLLICGMLAEHRFLVSLIAELALACDPFQVATAAAAAQAVFTVHLAKENDLLLPALDRAGLDLHAILDGMHEILGHSHDNAAQEAQHDGCGCGCDHDAADAQPVPLQIGMRPQDGGDLDVRSLPHGQRHEIIFGRLEQLQPGQSLVIVNDHDPKPLRYQFEAENAGEFSWQYLEQGPQVWRVRIGRTAAPAAS